MFEELCKKILRRCLYLCKDIDNFSGLGFILASKKVLNKYSLPLRPNEEKKIIKKLNSKCNKNLEDISKILIKLSTTKRYHDGFTFLDKNFKIIGICRTLIICKKTKIKPNKNRGTRFYLSKIFSSYNGVYFVGIIESDKKGFYFIRGKEFKT